MFHSFIGKYDTKVPGPEHCNARYLILPQNLKSILEAVPLSDVFFIFGNTQLSQKRFCVNKCLF